MSHRTSRARCALAALGLSAWLSACDIPRPDDAYDAADLDQPIGSVTPPSDSGAGMVMVDASIPTFLGGAGGTAGGAQGGSGMAGGQAGGTAGTAGGQAGGDAGGAGGSEGGVGGTAGGGMPGTSVSPEVARLQKLAGYYYMRMDMRSTVSGQSFLGAVRTRNRVSHLLVTQLGVSEGGQLVGMEQLCHQTFDIVCEAGCSQPSSSMRPDVLVELVKVRPQRNYQVTASGSMLRLTGEQQTMHLGFDATSNTALPANTSDARVWANGGGAREGLWLYLSTRSESGFSSVTCDVYTAQSFVSQFEGTLAGTLDNPALAGMSASLDTSGTAGKTLGASDNNCRDDPNNPPTTTTVDETVRFAPANVAAGQEAAFWSCPAASAWDGALPPPAP